VPVQPVDANGLDQNSIAYIADPVLAIYHRCFFILFMGGLFAMIKKSGGLAALGQDFAWSATWSRSGQLAVFAAAGLLSFFDDYTSILVVGKSMAPLMDHMSISREKLAFLVDATAAPVSSINPGSSWAGFEIGLIQAEIDKIIERNGGIDDLSIEASGMAAFVKSIGYCHYPILMLILIPILIFTERDCGPMLIAERRARVFGSEVNTAGDDRLKPSRDTPARFWNMLLPIVALVFFLFLNFASSVSGDDEPASETDSAFVVSVFATAVVTQIFYSLQYKKDGELAWLCLPHQRDGEWTCLLAPTFLQRKQKVEAAKDIEAGSKAASTSKHDDSTDDSTSTTTESQVGTVLANQDGFASPEQANVDMVVTEGSADEEEDISEQRPKVLLSFREGMESFAHGMRDVSPILIILTLAWAFGSLLTAVGTDRFISRMITGDSIKPESLPTLAFVASLFISLATGSSWGTMAIMFPLALVPTFEASGGDADIFYATISGIASGAVAGDHVSPISSTSILTAHATNCDLHAHVRTQAPYAIMVIVPSIIFGTVPVQRELQVGFGAFSHAMAYLFSILCMVSFVYLLCSPILDAKGRFDCFTERIVERNDDSELKELKTLTVDAYQRHRVKIQTAQGESATRRENRKAKKAAKIARIEEKRAKRKEESEVVLAAQSRLTRERNMFQLKLEDERLRQKWKVHLQKRMTVIQKKITALEVQNVFGLKQLPFKQALLEVTTNAIEAAATIEAPEVRNVQILMTETTPVHEKEVEISHLYAELGALSRDYTALAGEISRVKVQALATMSEIGEEKSKQEEDFETAEIDEDGQEEGTDEDENENEYDEDDTEDDTTQAISLASKFTRYEPNALQFDREPTSPGYKLLISIGRVFYSHLEEAGAAEHHNHSFDEIMHDVSYTFEDELSETEIRNGGHSKSRGGDQQQETASEKGGAEESDCRQEEVTETGEIRVIHRSTTEEC
jgi:Na+/H+ antiporter NhaC